MAEPNSILNVITQSAIDYVEKSKQAEIVQVDNAKKAQAIVGQSEAILQRVGEDQAIIAYQQGLAKLNAEKAARNAAAAAGVDPTNGSGTIIELLTEMRKKQVETADLLAKRRAELNVNPLKNPLAWISAQVDWNATGFNLETSAQQLELASNSLGKINQALQQSVQTTNVLQESVTQATVEAGTRLAASDVLLKAQVAALEGLKYNSLEVQLAKEGSGERLRALYDANSAVRQDEQLRLSLEQFKWQKEKWDWDKEQRLLDKESKAVGKMADDLTLEYINKSLASFGQPPIDAREAATQLQLFKSGASKDLQYHYQNGRRITTTGVSMIGNSPAESVEVLTQLPSNLPEQRAQVAQLLAQVKTLLDQSKDPRLTEDKANAGARAQFVNTRVNAEIARQYSGIVSNSGNLFDVGDIGAFIGVPGAVGIRSLHALPISQKLLIPAIQGGQPLSDPKVVIGLTIEAVRKGMLTSSEASSGLSEIYQRANLINQAARGFTGFGIVPPNAGKNYYAKIGAFGATVDLANPTDVGRYITKEAANKAFQEYRSKKVFPSARNFGQPAGQ